MTKLDRRLDREPTELFGEKFAREYVEREDPQTATEQEKIRYLASRKLLITRKRNQGGVIGVAVASSIKTTYCVTLPCYDGKQLTFRNPVQAAMFYNQYVSDKFGEHAVLCDVRAVVRRYLVDEIRGQFLV